MSKKSEAGMALTRARAHSTMGLMRTPRRLAVSLALALVATLFALLIAEVGIRVFLPQKLFTDYHEIWRPDSLYGWRHRENVDTFINSGEGAVRFVTNGNGFRIDPARAPTPHDVDGHSILCIGDSFLEAIQVEHRFTIPAVLERELRAQDPGVQVSITNSSVGGWGPSHYYLEAQRLASGQYSLAIVFLYAANDMICEKVQRFAPQQLHVYNFEWPRRFTKPEINRTILYPINETVERYSHLYVLIKNRTKWLRMRLGISPYYFPNVFLTSADLSACWETTAEVCASIHDEFSRYGTPCVFVLLPAEYQVHEEICRFYTESLEIDSTSVDLGLPNETLGRLFQSSSLLLIDPLEHMRSEAQAGIRMYGHIDSHLNAEGHRVVAEYILPTVSPLLFNPSP